MSWIILAVVVLGVAFWFVVGVRRIGAVSAGDTIREQSETVFWDAGTFTEAAKAEAKTQILAEVDAVRSNGIPVIGFAKNGPSLRQKLSRDC